MVWPYEEGKVIGRMVKPEPAKAAAVEALDALYRLKALAEGDG